MNRQIFLKVRFVMVRCSAAYRSANRSQGTSRHYQFCEWAIRLNILSVVRNVVSIALCLGAFDGDFRLFISSYPDVEPLSSPYSFNIYVMQFAEWLNELREFRAERSRGGRWAIRFNLTLPFKGVEFDFPW